VEFNDFNIDIYLVNRHFFDVLRNDECFDKFFLVTPCFLPSTAISKGLKNKTKLIHDDEALVRINYLSLTLHHIILESHGCLESSFGKLNETFVE